MTCGRELHKPREEDPWNPQAGRTVKNLLPEDGPHRPLDLPFSEHFLKALVRPELVERDLVFDGEGQNED